MKLVVDLMNANLTFYQMCSIFILPYVLVLFGFDFLTNDFTHSFYKTGFLQLLHHIIGAFSVIWIQFFLTNDITYFLVSYIVTFIILCGLYKNDGYCWYSIMINTIIDPSRPIKKWRSSPCHYLRHYLLGDEWAYGDIRLAHTDMDQFLLVLIPLIKGVQIMINK